MQEIILSRSAKHEIRNTVGKHPPETGGILVGSPDEPNIVKLFRFCPPARLADGSFHSGAGHWGMDGLYANWAIDNEWAPNGLYVLGFLHSHPSGCTRLSGGDMSGVAGDIPVLTACLNAPEFRATGLKQILAPIATFDANDRLRLDGWILRRGSTTPEPAKIVMREEAALEPAGSHEEPPAYMQRADHDAGRIDTYLWNLHRLLRRPELGFLERMIARYLFTRAYLDSQEGEASTERSAL